MTIPKLRFKADDGSDFPNWEEKELGQILTEDLCPVKNPDNAYTKLAIRSHGKGTFDRYVEAGESLDVDKMFEVKANRLILNITFAWELAIAITTKEDEGKLVSHRFPQYMISGNVDFYKYRLINERMRYDLGVASPGGAGRNRVLNKSAFLKIRKYIPSLPEQQKIAEFLSTIDTVIEKQKEAVSAWEERKKGVMQKLFSQEVRFKADDGSAFPEWEEKYLSDIASFHSGLTYTPDDVVDSENGILVFRSSNIQNGKIAYDDNVYVDKELKEKNYVKLHDIVVCVRNGSKSLVGKNALVNESDLNATWGAFMTVIRAKQNYEFVHQYLNSTFFKKEMHKDSGTATINQITTAMLNGCKLFVPSLAEQQKIADCLSSLDEAIEKQKATLAAWEELKKGLLQQMFV